MLLLGDIVARGLFPILKMLRISVPMPVMKGKTSQLTFKERKKFSLYFGEKKIDKTETFTIYLELVT